MITKHDPYVSTGEMYALARRHSLMVPAAYRLKLRGGCEGNGHKEPTFRNYWLDITVSACYSVPVSNDEKYAGQLTPFGSAVADVVRANGSGLTSRDVAGLRRPYSIPEYDRYVYPGGKKGPDNDAM